MPALDGEIKLFFIFLIIYLNKIDLDVFRIWTGSPEGKILSVILVTKHSLYGQGLTEVTFPSIQYRLPLLPPPPPPPPPPKVPSMSLCSSSQTFFVGFCCCF